MNSDPPIRPDSPPEPDGGLTASSGAPTRRPRRAGGWILVVIGLGFFLLQIIQGPRLPLFLLVSGAAFLALYFLRRNYGFLVPGCVLAAVGAAGMVDASVRDSQGWEQLLIGLGFLAIWGIDRIARGETPWWPLAPGGILAALGLAAMDERVSNAFAVGWPLVLVAIGVLLLTGVVGKRAPGD